jgi:hypothetical protein
MHQSHHFKNNSNDVSAEKDKPITTQKHNPSKLCLYWLDGRKIILNYAYFVMADLQPDKGKNTRLYLIFTSHIVSLDGYNLVVLFNMFADGLPERINQQDKRYSALIGKENYIVHTIDIKAEN